MSIYAMFNRFKKRITIPSKPAEHAILTRVGKSNGSNFKSNFVYTALLQENTQLVNGDVFSCTLRGKLKNFIVISVRSTEQSIQATVYECNCTVDIYRMTTRYDAADNPIGNDTVLIGSTPANYVTVNASMRMFDAGYLKSTTREFRMPTCDIKLTDRIVLGTNKLCVDVIDETKFYGLLAVQTSEDNRSL